MNELDKTKHPAVTMARLIVSAIPAVGGPASLLVEKSISERREANLNEYLVGLERRIRKIEDGDLPSDDLIVRGANAAAKTHEKWKPHIFSSVVGNRKVNAEDIFREHLIFTAESLSLLEFCALTRLAVSRREPVIVAQFKELREAMSRLESHDPKVRDLSHISHGRLTSLGLAVSIDQAFEVSPIGELLLDVLSE
jgi:hypothetical protein